MHYGGVGRQADIFKTVMLSGMEQSELKEAKELNIEGISNAT